MPLAVRAILGQRPRDGPAVEPHREAECQTLARPLPRARRPGAVADVHTARRC